jgi:SAM-dependent methyltransferase
VRCISKVGGNEFQRTLDVLKKIDPAIASKWSISIDEEKYKFVNGIIDSKHATKCDESQKFLQFLRSKDYYRHSAHFLRYFCTFNAICKFPDVLRGGLTVVETGGSSPISDFLSLDNECYATDGDLREGIDCQDCFADVVFSFEVLEHIKDRPEKDFSEVVLFRETGVRRYIDEMERILKPGGFLFLTTPNPCGLWALRRLLRGEAPMVFRPHVREYSKDEIVNLFHLNLVHHHTMYNFANLDDGVALSKQIFTQLGALADDRGDDHMFCFKKH